MSEEPEFVYMVMHLQPTELTALRVMQVPVATRGPDYRIVKFPLHDRTYQEFTVKDEDLKQPWCRWHLTRDAADRDLAFRKLAACQGAIQRAHAQLATLEKEVADAMDVLQQRPGADGPFYEPWDESRKLKRGGQFAIREE